MTLDVQLTDKRNTDYENLKYNSNNNKWCASNSLFTVDGMSFFLAFDANNSPYIFSVNTYRPKNKILYRLSDEAVIQSSMTDYSARKFYRILNSNMNIIQKKVRRGKTNA